MWWHFHASRPAPLQFATLLISEVRHPVVLHGGGLKRADVSDDHPPVFGPDAVVVAEHLAVAVADDVIEMSIGDIPQAIDME